MIKMKLNSAPFEQMKNGEKVIELRLNDEKRREISVGDEIVFTHAENDALHLDARVVALHKYPSFKLLFEEAGLLERAGFYGYTITEACDRMHSYYTPERENQYGVLGIEIELSEE